MNRTVQLIVALLAGMAFGAQAESTPEAVVSAMTEQVLVRMASSSSDRARVKELVEQTVLPNVDFVAMTAHAVGPQWKSASESQRGRLVSGFEALLMKTYANAFSEVAGARFRLRSSVSHDDGSAEVRSEVILRGGGEPFTLNYRLTLREDHWKITDVSMMGVWLVATYRSQFSQVMEQSGGVDGLIRRLEEKSR